MMKSVYVALVPVWLGDFIRQSNTSIDVITDLNKLSTTLSHKDVCFYVAIQKHIQRYFADLFDDMGSIVDAPCNQAWVIENSREIGIANEQLQHSLSQFETSLVDRSVPRTIRKTNYIPESVGSNCLAIVGTGSGDQYSHAAFVDACVERLHSLTTVPHYQQLNVFKAFTQVAA